MKQSAILLALSVALGARLACAQAPGFASVPGKAETAAVMGLFNWIHSTADVDKGYEFYQSVLNMRLSGSPFGGNVDGGPAAKIRPRAQGSRDPLIWDLTNTKGSLFRNAFMRRPGDTFGHELSEFTDIDQHLLHPRPQDPGATMLIAHVTNLDETVAALKKAGGEIVSSEGKPVTIGGKRAIIARDPEGYLLELIESEQRESSVGITVANLENTRHFYEGLLGFTITSPAGYESKDLKLMGLAKGEYRVSSALVPGTSIRFEFYEYRKLMGADAPQPVHYRFQDPGAPQGQFHVRDLDHLLDESKERGVPFLSKDQKPIERAFGRFVFVIDPDGVFVEMVQPKQ